MNKNIKKILDANKILAKQLKETPSNIVLSKWQLKLLKEHCEFAIAMAEKFIKKVETGRVISTETYQDMLGLRLETKIMLDTITKL